MKKPLLNSEMAQLQAPIVLSQQEVFWVIKVCLSKRSSGFIKKNTNQGGLAATFDLAAFRKVMIAPVKKSVNHSKTVTSMREMRRIHVILSVATWRWKTHSY